MEFEVGKKYRCLAYHGSCFKVGDIYESRKDGEITDRSGHSSHCIGIEGRFEEIKTAKTQFEAGKRYRCINPNFMSYQDSETYLCEEDGKLWNKQRYALVNSTDFAVEYFEEVEDEFQVGDYVKTIEVDSAVPKLGSVNKITAISSCGIFLRFNNEAYGHTSTRFKKLKPLTKVPPKGSKIVKIEKSHHGSSTYDSRLGEVLESGGIACDDSNCMWVIDGTSKLWTEDLADWALVELPRTVGVKFSECGKTYHYLSRDANVGDKLEITNEHGTQVVTVVEVGNNKLAIKEAGKVLNAAEVVAGEREGREILKEETVLEVGDEVEVIETFTAYCGTVLQKGSKHTVTCQPNDGTLKVSGIDSWVSDEEFKKPEKPLEDGWIAWSGGKCPLKSGDRAFIRFKTGVNFDDAGDETTWDGHTCVDWEHSKGREAYKVAAYKLIKAAPVQETKETRQFCGKYLDIDELLAECEEFDDALGKALIRAAKAETKWVELQDKDNERKNREFPNAIGVPHKVGANEVDKKPSIFSLKRWI